MNCLERDPRDSHTLISSCYPMAILMQMKEGGDLRSMLTTGESACHAKIVGTCWKRLDKTLLMKRGEVFVNSETKRVHIRTVVTKVFHNTWFLTLSQCFLNFRFLVLLVLLVCFSVRRSHAWTQPKGISIIKSSPVVARCTLVSGMTDWLSLLFSSRVA